jgi:hypothetical protein
MMLIASALMASPSSAVELSVSEQVPGEVGVYTAVDAGPGATVVFVFGSTESDGCTPPMERCIRPGLELGRVVADARGVAVLRRTVPTGAPRGRFLFQAFIPGAAASEPLAAWITAPSSSGSVAAR